MIAGLFTWSSSNAASSSHSAMESTGRSWAMDTRAGSAVNTPSLCPRNWSSVAESPTAIITAIVGEGIDANGLKWCCRVSVSRELEHCVLIAWEMRQTHQ